MDQQGTLLLALGPLSLDLNDTDLGFIVSEFDPGAPQPRAVVTDLPGQDGQDDQTAYFSTRTVQINAALTPDAEGNSRSAVFDTLAPFLAPGARPTLTYAADTDVAPRLLNLRVSQWSNPIDHPGNASAFSIQWVCSDPIAYGLTQDESTVPFSTGSTEGRTYPRIYPLTYPGGGGAPGEATIVNVGTYGAWPILRIFGPCANPAIYWLDPITLLPLGPQVVFTGMNITDGNYVEVNTKNRTALLNGLPSSNQYSFLDFAATTWGPLQPGATVLRFAPSSASTDSEVVLLWTPAYL